MSNNWLTTKTANVRNDSRSAPIATSDAHEYNFAPEDDVAVDQVCDAGLNNCKKTADFMNFTTSALKNGPQDEAIIYIKHII